jgi:hypothetical protein
MQYEAACHCLDVFCAQVKTRGALQDLGDIAHLLDTVNDCVKEYSRLRGLGDPGKWGSNMRFYAETEGRILDEHLAQYKPTIEARAEDFTVTGNDGVRHCMLDVLQRIRTGIKLLLLPDALTHLALQLEAWVVK